MNTDQNFKIETDVLYPDFRIEKGVPFPEKPPAPAKIFYPLEKMKIGDSFLIPTETAESLINSVRRRIDHQIAQVFGRNPNTPVFRAKAFKTGIRVWRIS